MAIILHKYTDEENAFDHLNKARLLSQESGDLIFEVLEAQIQISNLNAAKKTIAIALTQAKE